MIILRNKRTIATLNFFVIENEDDFFLFITQTNSWRQTKAPQIIVKITPQQRNTS